MKGVLPMPITETLILSVGPSIAKSILRCWLKDDLITEFSPDIFDLFMSKITDIRARQRTKRQFEEIGERVADSLLPIFNLEGKELDEGTQEIVANTFAEILEKASISSQLLIEKDLSPKKLEQYLNELSNDAIKLFSQAESALFQRLISESSQLIIDISSQLPQFSERTFAEIFKRGNSLQEIVLKVLDEVHRIRQVSERANPEEQARRFEEDYRREVVRSLDRVEIYGATISDESRRYSLSVAYVTLSMKQNIRNEGYPVVEENDLSILSADEVLTKTSYLLIRGPAGSGKTILLQWIAVNSASQSFKYKLNNLNNTIPFFIRLREYTHTNLPRPESFPSLIAPAIAAMMPDLWVHNQLKDGRAIVLIDGIDEVPNNKREEVRQWLQGLISAFPNARFILTSRPHAVEEGWMKQNKFEEADLQPMELANIYTFIDHWHNAICENLNDQNEKTELIRRAETLKIVLSHERSLRNLATNPLLCAMICALHRDRHAKIPKDRIELYEACCHMLIHRRDSERQIELEDYPPLKPRQTRLLLEDIAYWMLKNHFTSVTFETAETHLEPKIVNLQGLPHKVKTIDVLRLLVDRTGIIREPVKGQLDFTHRTFQEFLAAQAAIDENDIGILINQAHDDQWREVVILAIGLAKRRVGELIIKGLLDRGDLENKLRHQLHLLAVASLETAVELSPDIKEEVQKRLIILVPPKNFIEAEAVASAGELAIPYLLANDKQELHIAAACVRALARIGGKDSFNALKGYIHDLRPGIQNELIQAWDSFNRKEYAKCVLLPIFKKSTNLKLERLSSLEGIEYFNHITELVLDDCSQIDDLRPLISLQKLTKLHLLGCSKVEDISPLAQLKNLTFLHLSGYNMKISDLTPLASLPKLSLDRGNLTEDLNRQWDRILAQRI
jgi:hypothetical protein